MLETAIKDEEYYAGKEPGALSLRRKKVAIIGGGPTRRRAPFSDPSWEIWAFSSHLWRPPRIDRWFEIHAMTDLRQQLGWKKRGRRSFGGYMRFMRNLDCPVYMQRVNPRIPTSLVFPVEDLLREFGRCFTSTAAYLIAFAIMEGYETIGLWGIDLRGPKYRRYRPHIKYLLSVARQRGIELVLPRSFPFKVPDTPRFVSTPILYAYDWRSPRAWWRYRLKRRLKKKSARRRR